MPRVLGKLAVVLLLAGCGAPPPAAPPPSSATPREYTWDERVVWPNGDWLVVSAPKFQDRDGTPNRVVTVVKVTVFNARDEGRRVGDQDFEASTDGRKIKPIMPDVDGRPVLFEPLKAGQSYSYEVAFATATLGERLTVQWRSRYAQHQPSPTISGSTAVQ